VDGRDEPGHDEAPGTAHKCVTETGFSAERSAALSLTYSKAHTNPETMAMTMLPVDRALRIYGTLADRSETRGARERLARHLMKKYIEGETDEHRLTVEGVSYLRNLDREIDFR
jgi:hypothetical protein